VLAFGSMFSLLPSPKVYGARPLVVTRAGTTPPRTYRSSSRPRDFSDDEVARYRTRALPVTLNFRAPLVPVTSVNGVGVPTVDKVVYWDGNFTETPRVVNGDGVGIVNLETVLALQRLVGDDPDQQYFKSVLIPNMTHNGMILDELGLRSVVKEILEANRATSF
jgi:hypothetical protein